MSFSLQVFFPFSNERAEQVSVACMLGENVGSGLDLETNLRDVEYVFDNIGDRAAAINELALIGTFDIMFGLRNNYGLLV